jgi:hypothetical protein
MNINSIKDYKILNILLEEESNNSFGKSLSGKKNQPVNKVQ